MVFQFVAKLERHTTTRARPEGTAEPDADSSRRNAIELEGRVVRADCELALYREPETGIVDPLGDEVSDGRWLEPSVDEVSITWFTPAPVVSLASRRWRK